MSFFNIDREIIVLKTVIENKKEAGIWLLAHLQDDHFGYNINKEIWERIKLYLSRGKDIPSLNVFKDDTGLSTEAITILAGSLLSLNNLIDSQNSLDILETYRKKRGMHNFLLKASTSFNDINVDINKTIQDLETNLITLRSTQSSLEIIRAGLNNNSAHIIDNILHGDPNVLIKTGIDKFDNKSGGFARGDFVVLVGPSGGGKSLLALQMALNQYQMGYNSCIVSFEMNEIEIYQRILSNLADINHGIIKRKLLNPGEKNKIQEKWLKFKTYGQKENCNLSLICPKQGLNASQICNILKPYNYDCVYIDYLSLVDHTEGKTEAIKLGNSARIFKLGATGNNSVIVGLAQYNEEKKRIKYATAIQDHASYLWQWEYGDDERELQKIDLIQNKVRNGERFKIPMIPDFNKCRWGNGVETNEYENKNITHIPTMEVLENTMFDGDDL